MMTANWKLWQALQRGEQVKLINEQPEPGYWRLPIKGRTEGGASLTIGYHAIAFWPDEQATNGEWRVLGTINNEKDLTHEGCVTLWSYVAGLHISHAQFQAYVDAPPDSRVWFDQEKINAAIRKLPKVEVDRGVLEKAEQRAPAEPQVPKDKELLAMIESYETEVTAIKEIETQEQHDEIARKRGVVAELRLMAKREQTAEMSPHYKLYIEARDKWGKPIKLAESVEARAKKLQDDWGTMLLQAQKRAEEENARRAERFSDHATSALQNGEEMPEAPEEVVPNTPPPPVATKAGAGGRLKRARTVKKVTITDQDAVYRFFRDAEAIATVLQQLAQAKVNAGVTDIPGTSIEDAIST